MLAPQRTTITASTRPGNSELIALKFLEQIRFSGSLENIVWSKYRRFEPKGNALFVDPFIPTEYT